MATSSVASTVTLSVPGRARGQNQAKKTAAQNPAKDPNYRPFNNRAINAELPAA